MPLSPRLLYILALTACAAPDASGRQRDTARSEQPARAEASCQCDPKLVGQCFTVRGSLAHYRTPPAARISIAGSKRQLGLKDGPPDWLEEDFEEPGNVVTGDFLVCPFTRRKAGAMQLVCIEAAHNMVAAQRRK